MAYRFKLGEDFGKGLRRIGEEQIERAISQLMTAEAGAAVHETRKCLKRVRALLRLVRSSIGKAAFARENKRFGDIGRMLSDSRDQTVLHATLDMLIAEHPEHVAILRGLKKSIPGPAKGARVAASRLGTRARGLLEKSRQDWQALALDQDGFEAIGQGLARGLSDLRSALMAAEAGHDEAVHDWRKAVQRHWRHMLLLREAWPEYFVARADEAKEVSELLGQAQDLTLLITKIKHAVGSHVTPAKAEAVVSLAKAKRQTLRQVARERCVRLVAEGPDGHAQRAEDYWRAACGLKATAQIPSPQRAPAVRLEAHAAALDGLPRAARKLSGASKVPSRPLRGATAKPGGRKRPRGRTVR